MNIPQPEHYSEAEWFEINELYQKAKLSKDPYVIVWFDRQVTPVIKKEKIIFAELEDVLEFLNSDSPDRPRKIGKMPYNEAVRQSQKSQERFNKKIARKLNLKDSEKDIRQVFEYEDDIWVELLSDDAYFREGKNMVHCVGNHIHNYRDSTIYSLRDLDNSPHCTVEVRNNKVLQIKGKQNKLVVLAYHKSLFAFLQFLKIKIDTHDLEQYGFILCVEGNFDESSLPNEVTLLSDRKVTLSKHARIPKKLIGKDVEIKTNKPLDLSHWQVKTISIVGHGQQVKLPPNAKVITLENVKINTTKMIISTISVENCEIVCDDINADTITIKSGVIKSNNITTRELTTLTEGSVECHTIRLDKFMNQDNKEQNIIADQIYVDKILMLDYSENMKSLVDKMILGSEVNIKFKNLTNKAFVLPWEKIHSIEYWGEIDFTQNIKEIFVFKQWNNAGEQWIVMSMKEQDVIHNMLPVILKQKHDMVNYVNYYDIFVEAVAST